VVQWGRLFPGLAAINCLHKCSPKLCANERAAKMKLETAEGFGQVIAGLFLGCFSLLYSKFIKA
jgi:hypothetical protein